MLQRPRRPLQTISSGVLGDGRSDPHGPDFAPVHCRCCYAYRIAVRVVYRNQDRLNTVQGVDSIDSKRKARPNLEGEDAYVENLGVMSW